MKTLFPLMLLLCVGIAVAAFRFGAVEDHAAAQARMSEDQMVRAIVGLGLTVEELQKDVKALKATTAALRKGKK